MHPLPAPILRACRHHAPTLDEVGDVLEGPRLLAVAKQRQRLALERLRGRTRRQAAAGGMLTMVRAIPTGTSQAGGEA